MQSIAGILKNFEYAKYLVVSQYRGKIHVKMPRLNLGFYVNSKGLLESPQLSSEVDPEQDMGCWYGLNSSILLRDIKNSGRKSIIVPIGPISYRRHGVHIAVNVQNEGRYGRYHINNLLGRLDCAAVPVLMYFKAQLHAYTSFFLPDPLTARTGVEEASNILTSGQAQPWTPLSENAMAHLRMIAKLTCVREYYPPDLRYMQKVSFDRELTIHIQCDSLAQLATSVVQKSVELGIFHDKQNPSSKCEEVSGKDLTLRSQYRRQLYQRSTLASNGLKAPADTEYHTPMLQTIVACQKRTQIVVNYLHQWKDLPTIQDLSHILQSWPTVEGFTVSFENRSLNDVLSVKLHENFGSVFNHCVQSEPHEKEHLLFLLGILSFHEDIDLDLLRVLCSASIQEDLKVIPVPRWPTYNGYHGSEVPDSEFIRNCIKPYCADSSQHELDEDNGEIAVSVGNKSSKRWKTMESAYTKRLNFEVERISDEVLAQWPCAEPTLQDAAFKIIDVDEAFSSLSTAWLRLYQNQELHIYLRAIQIVLDRHHADDDLVDTEVIVPDRMTFLPSLHAYQPPFLTQMLRKSGPGMEQPASGPPAIIRAPRATYKQTHHAAYESLEAKELGTIISKLTSSASAISRQYGGDLNASLKALNTLKRPPQNNSQLPKLFELADQIWLARKEAHDRFENIETALERGDPRARWLRRAGIWPSTSRTELAQTLRSTSGADLGESMKESIIEWCLAISRLQRLQRIEQAIEKNDTTLANQEAAATGHLGWCPFTIPDWLLLEIDADILIRKEQCAMAFEMISPSSNSIYQLNMGKGKSSVIIPMITVLLADSKDTLARVIVPRNLLNQMGQILQDRLGKLLGREIVHCPFSRRNSTKMDTVRAFFSNHKRMLSSAGVVLAVPEMILSFKLSGYQRLLDQHVDEGIQMIKVQNYLDKHCRSIVDEADETMSPRLQLIYPSGALLTLDTGHARWTAIQTVLRLSLKHLDFLRHSYPKSVEIVPRSIGFPFIHVLRKDFEDALINRVADDVCLGAVFPTIDFTESERGSLKTFMCETNVSNEVLKRIDNMFATEPNSKKLACLIRGLCVDRILISSLKKRWNVQYGLHSGREVSVPIYQKDELLTPKAHVCSLLIPMHSI